MKKILLIVNPVAGTLKARSALFEIVNEFCKAGYDVTVHTTLHRGHATELAENAADDGYEIVVCCGGDGTLNETITGLIHSGSGLPCGYIPAGSTNDCAETLGISPFPAEAAKAIAREKPMLIDMGSFNESRCFGYIASFGAFTSTSYSAPQDMKNKLGHLAYILQGIKDATEIKSIKASFEANGKKYSGEYLFGSVSNTTSVAGIVKLKPSIVDLTDGMFEVIMVKKPNNIFEMNEIIVGVTQSRFESNMFEFFKASEIHFKMPKSAKWTLDGEKAEHNGEIIIKNLHNIITMYK